MIVPPALKRQYSDITPELEVLAARVRETVFTYCDKKGFAYLGRIKTLESFAEKVETGRFGSCSELDDLFACVIIIPSLTLEEEVLQFLQEVFKQISVKKRGTTKKSPEVFRFDATRFIGRLNIPDGLESSERRYNINFEVQIRSAFEHAWSVTTHALAYKAESIDWKMQRVAAQLKASVEQLDSIVQGFAVSADMVVEHGWPELETKKIIIETFSGLVERAVIPDFLAPKDWSRFAENLYSLLKLKDGAYKHRTVTDVVNILEQEISSLNSDMIPRSISILQLMFGIMVRLGILRPSLSNYFPLITEELITLYPETASFEARFLLAG